MQFFFPLLTLIFITLKLMAVGVVATWSWWWVLAPIWIPVTIGCCFLLLGAILGAAGIAVTKRRRNRPW